MGDDFMFIKWGSYCSGTKYDTIRPKIRVCNVQQKLEFSEIFPKFSTDSVCLEAFITGDRRTKIYKEV